MNIENIMSLIVTTGTNKQPSRFVSKHTTLTQVELRRKLRANQLVKLCTGRYMDYGTFMKMSTEEKYLTNALALQSRSEKLVLSHTSAAVFYGIAVFELCTSADLTFRAPPHFEVTKQRVKVHRYNDNAVLVRKHGVRVTSIEQTIIDCCRDMTTIEALTIVDSALQKKLTTKKKIKYQMDLHSNFHHCTQVMSILNLAAHSGSSVGESLTRLAFYQLGLPKPKEQVVVNDTQENTYYKLDFAYPEQKVCIEFDGMIKYSGGFGNPTGVLIGEKKREDRIRALTGWRVIRLTWDIVKHPVKLREELKDIIAAFAHTPQSISSWVDNSWMDSEKVV